MTLHIKNMVCDRCILVVRQQLENLGFNVLKVSLGTAEISPEPDDSAMLQISSALQLVGFELIDEEKGRLVEQIRNTVIQLVHHTDLSENRSNFSDLIAAGLHKDYAYLSRIFSESEESTIEKFIIQQKIEKVKELLEYGQLNLNEIAYQLGYSSSAHLSAQFKQVTGVAPSKYNNGRKPIDKVK